MRYRLTYEDVELLEFSKRNKAITGVDERYQRTIGKLEKAASQGDALMILGNLQANTRLGSCDVNTRIAEVVFAQVCEYLQTKPGEVYSAEFDSQYSLSPN